MGAAGFGDDPNRYTKIVIPHQLKSDLLRNLYSMNVTSPSLFPDLDGVGRGIRDLAKVLVWHQENTEDLTNLSMLGGQGAHTEGSKEEG